ncbi:MAG: hypothetical protein R2795_09385 [Saprospiraceae bacterium]
MCSTGSPVTLPTLSNNGISGTWSPAVIDPSGGSNVTATFTPNAGQCASPTTMTVVVNAATVPTFAPIAPLCQTGSTITLPTTSTNGINGTWSPATVNPASGNNVTATFTPSSGQCATTTMITVMVNAATNPTFTNPALCARRVRRSPCRLPQTMASMVRGHPRR